MTHLSDEDRAAHKVKVLREQIDQLRQELIAARNTWLREALEADQRRVKIYTTKGTYTVVEARRRSLRARPLGDPEREVWFRRTPEGWLEDSAHLTDTTLPAKIHQWDRVTNAKKKLLELA